MKILVIHSWGLGDLILATPMLRSLALSGYEVDLVLFSKSNADILKENDFIRDIFIVNSKLDFFKFFKKYDYLVATAGTNVKKIRLLNLIIGAKRVFASAQERDIHRIDMNLEIVQPILKEKTKEPYIYLNNNKAILDKYVDKNRKNIGFAVGSGVNQKFKRWDKYQELIQKTEGNKLVFIGPDEMELEEEYKKLDVTIVKESLLDTIYLISNLGFLLGNDNGLMHIGYATKINTVTIIGMTNERETGGYRENNKSLFLDMECRPCFNPATDYVGCKTYDCLKKLSVGEVWKSCQEFL